jgi:hypothetical protein
MGGGSRERAIILYVIREGKPERAEVEAAS